MEGTSDKGMSGHISMLGLPGSSTTAACSGPGREGGRHRLPGSAMNAIVKAAGGHGSVAAAMREAWGGRVDNCERGVPSLPRQPIAFDSGLGLHLLLACTHRGRRETSVKQAGATGPVRENTASKSRHIHSQGCKSALALETSVDLAAGPGSRTRLPIAGLAR